ncbi:MAG: cyclic nucleotide-binding domain-containing protein, partial [Alphaproteobacteria bacterium]
MAGTARIRHRSPVEWLKNVRVFETVPDDILKRIYGECHLQTMERGEPLFKAGDEPNALFILTSGRVRTSLPAELGKSEVGPGCVLGEAAFLTRVAHQATVTAVRSSIVLKLEWDSFQVLAEGAPEVWQAIIQALVRLGGKVAAQPAIEGLGQNLPGGIALDDPQVVHWLKEQESRFDVIVLIADAEPTPWTQKTLAEADEICLVATHDGGRLGTPVPLGPVEELAFETRGADACRLALFHDPKRGAGQTAGTRRWLEYRPVRAHHHLRPGQPVDFQRLARFLLSQSTGLFATAPGAFGAVTLGIYKAVQAAGFEIDCFAG